MTRTQVYRRVSEYGEREVVADYFQDHENERAMRLTVGSSGCGMTFDEGDPIDVFLFAYDATDTTEDDFDYADRVTVKHDDDTVFEGNQSAGRGDSVVIVHGSGRLTIPTGNHVTLELYGEKA